VAAVVFEGGGETHVEVKARGGIKAQLSWSILTLCRYSLNYFVAVLWLLNVITGVSVMCARLVVLLTLQEHPVKGMLLVFLAATGRTSR
jgi:hypothetical protein